MLQVDEIDLYLIHNPFAKENRLELWEAMVELKKQGKVKHIGVSNYNVHHIKEIKEAGIEMPAANQIEIHPWHVIPQPLAEYMDKHEILPIAYSTLAALISKVVVFPAGDLGEASNLIRLIVVFVCVAVFFIAKRNLVYPTVLSAILLTVLIKFV